MLILWQKQEAVWTKTWIENRLFGCLKTNIMQTKICFYFFFLSAEIYQRKEKSIN